MNNKFHNTLSECRELFGTPSRNFSLYQGWKNKISLPLWARLGDDKRFEEIFLNQLSLLKDGKLVWGKIIQANSMLFSSGKSNHPAAIIYSLDNIIDNSPEIIEEAASQLYSFKGKNTENPELQIFADKLANEVDADLKLAIPKELTEGVECFYTCIMVHRNHLPNKILSMGLFPLLVNPERTDATMILPSKYWQLSFIELWKNS